MDNCLAIITARGGSKRIPRKNIKNFLGHPIIKYSIDAALNAGCFKDVIVSTDDEEIAEIAKSYGASVPFLRSQDTSDDFATTVDVLTEVLNELRKIGKNYDYCCGIYPTAPFVTSAKLQQAYTNIVNSQAQSVVPIVRFGFPILRSFKIENGLVKMNWPEHMVTRSQDLPAAYHDCGQFYFLEVRSFLEHKKLFPPITIPLEMPETEVQDIDTEEDWKIAEIKYSLLLDKGV